MCEVDRQIEIQVTDNDLAWIAQGMEIDAFVVLLGWIFIPMRSARNRTRNS